MNPFDLIINDVIKDGLFRLAGGIIKFVPNWAYNCIGPNMMCDFSRLMPAQEALN